MKDWTGNKTSMVCMGVHNYSDHKRERNDFYATDPLALELLLEKESFSNVWECACGQGHLSKVLIKHNIHGRSSDLVDRGFGEVEDFLKSKRKWDGDIITNPPYRFAKEFILKALELTEKGRKIAMLLRVQFLESVGRYVFLNAIR